MPALNIYSYNMAAFPFLAVKTLEPLRAEKVIRAEVEDTEELSMFKWDITRNFSTVISDAKEPGTEKGVQIQDALERFVGNNNDSVLVINNINESFNPQLTQLFFNYADVLKAKNLTVIFIDSTFSKMKSDFRRLVSFLDLKLPTAGELYSIAKECYEAVSEDDGRKNMTDEELQNIAEQSRGLVEFEAESIYARSITVHGKILVEDVHEQKAMIIKENVALEVDHYTDLSFDDIGGMEFAKDFMKRTVNSPLSKGALIVGVPGVGKTLISKALATETGRWCISLNFSRLFDKYVGSTEEKVEMTLKTVDSLGKIVLRFDEIDKSVGASYGGGGKSSGNEVAKRAIGQVLTWLQDRKEGDAYIIASCNNVKEMVQAFPEFFRTGRWDIIISVDLPNEIEREAICKIKSKHFGIKGRPKNIVEWTGSDIEQLYKTAAMLECTLDEAKEYVLPLKDTASDAIQSIRDWMKGRAIPASKPLNIPVLNEKPGRNIKTVGKKKTKKKRV